MGLGAFHAQADLLYADDHERVTAELRRLQNKMAAAEAKAGKAGKAVDDQPTPRWMETHKQLAAQSVLAAS